MDSNYRAVISRMVVVTVNLRRSARCIIISFIWIIYFKLDERTSIWLPTILIIPQTPKFKINKKFHRFFHRCAIAPIYSLLHLFSM